MTEESAQEPSEILAARRKAAYLGSDVDWALRFADGYEELPGYVRLLFQSRLHERAYVAVTVPLADYPWLGRMRRGEPLQVRGRVAEIGSRSIELNEASLWRLT